MKENNDFLPQGYEPPQGNSNYMKILKGENRIRILSKPIIGWLDWKENKPLRFEMNNKPSAPVDPTKKIKHFWAFCVWNYAEKKVQILEVTQASIQSKINALSKDEDWGSPLNYDLKIIRTGEDMSTSYEVNPVPSKPIDTAIAIEYSAMIIDLNALYKGEDPFAMMPKEKAPF